MLELLPDGVKQYDIVPCVQWELGQLGGTVDVQCTMSVTVLCTGGICQPGRYVRQLELQFVNITRADQKGIQVG